MADSDPQAELEECLVEGPSADRRHRRHAFRRSARRLPEWRHVGATVSTPGPRRGGVRDAAGGGRSGGQPGGAPRAAGPQRRGALRGAAAGDRGAGATATERCGSTTCPAAVTVEARPLTPRALPVVLTPHVLPGGLGEHKWVDRRLARGAVGDGTTPLLLDADGTVLEAAWAAVLIRRDGDAVHAARGRADPAEHVATRRRAGRPAAAARRRAAAQLVAGGSGAGRARGHQPGTARRYASYSEPNCSPERRLLVAAHERDEQRQQEERVDAAGPARPSSSAWPTTQETTARYIGLRTQR